MEKSFVKTNVTGFAVVEVIDFEMHLNAEDQKIFDQEPEAVVKRLLEESGQVVNRMMLTNSFIERHKTHKEGTVTPRMMRVNGHYHIQYPANEKSGWICA